MVRSQLPPSSRFHEGKDLKKRGEAMKQQSSVRVAVRVRPESPAREAHTSARCLVPAASNDQTVVHFHHEAQTKTFTFDHVFPETSSQQDVYTTALHPSIGSFLNGFNVTVLAYGQTGSGKTYSVGNRTSFAPSSSPDRAKQISPPRIGEKDGLLPRFLCDVFAALKSEPSTKTMKVSFLEIYCDEIRDLLQDKTRSMAKGKPLTIREEANKVWVENLRHVQVDTVEKALEWMNIGRQRQATSATAMNDQSSRSHAIYTLEVSRKFAHEIKMAKLTFVDLAGSERIKKSKVEGTQLKESIQINVGLLALGNVIHVLGDDKALKRIGSIGKGTTPDSPRSGHVPYRSSKLTRLLRDALGGNANTLFIACVSSLDTNASETLSTLEYANRARNIQNKAEANVESIAKCESPRSRSHRVLNRSSSEIEISLLQQEVNHLKLELKDALTAKSALEKVVPSVKKVFVLRSAKSLEDYRCSQPPNSHHAKAEDSRGVQFSGAAPDTLRVPLVSIQALEGVNHAQLQSQAVVNIIMDKTHVTFDKDRVHSRETADSNKIKAIENEGREKCLEKTQVKANPSALHRKTSLATSSAPNENESVDNSASVQNVDTTTKSDTEIGEATEQTIHHTNHDESKENHVIDAEENQNELPHECSEPRPFPVLKLSDCISVISDVHSNEDLCEVIKIDTPKTASVSSPEVDSPRLDKTPELSPAALQRSMQILHSTDIFLSQNELVHPPSPTKTESCVESKEFSHLVVKSPEKDSAKLAALVSRRKVDLKELESAPKPDFTVERSPFVPAGLRRNNAQSSPFRPMKLFPFENQRPSPPNVTADLETLLQWTRDMITEELGQTGENQQSHCVPSVEMFVQQMKEAFSQRQSSKLQLAQLTAYLLTLETVLDLPSHDKVDTGTLQQYRSKYQLQLVQHRVDHCQSVAAQRLYQRMQNYHEALQLVSSEPTEHARVFLSDEQFQACAPWAVHQAADWSLFQRDVLPLVLNGWISVTPSDLEEEQTWLCL